jgi:alpha,alpha-trehalose phosphorylase
VGFGGVRNVGGVLSAEPKLPAPLTKLAFGVHWAGQYLRITVTPDQTEYDLDQGEPIPIIHYGEQLHVQAGRTETRPNPAPAPGPRPLQPPGRAPARRS